MSLRNGCLRRYLFGLLLIMTNMATDAMARDSLQSVPGTSGANPWHVVRSTAEQKAVQTKDVVQSKVGQSGASDPQYQHHPNSRVAGNEFTAFDATSLLECQQICSGAAGCQMFEYQRQINQCRIFTRAASIIFGGDADVGLKTGAKVAPSYQSNVPTSYAIQQRTWVKGEPYRPTLFGLTPDQCRDACSADTACRMYEYFQPKKGCGFFRHQQREGTAGQSEVGVKR